MKCLICGKEVNGFLGLASHLKFHKLTKKQYYDAYLRRFNENICLICGKETKFISLKLGYLETCSRSCGSRLGVKRYGSSFSLEKVQDKIKDTMIRKYGVVCGLMIDEIKDKIRQTNLERHGVEYPMQSEMIKKKSKETCLTRYGVDVISKNNVVRDKISQSKIKIRKFDKPLFNYYAHMINWAEDVRRSPEDNDILEVRCKKCNEWFVPTLNEIYNRIAAIKGQRGSSENNLYCSDECKQSCSIYNKQLYRNGENPNVDRPYQHEWAEEVKKIANNQCEICGCQEHLEAHHIFPVKTHPHLQADVDNGLCLCNNCHKKHGHQDECSTGQLAKLIC